jgi:hypothetical protein
MFSKPSGKKRARQAAFQASFTGPRVRPSLHTSTRIRFDENGLKMEECALPIPISSAPITFKLLEPLQLEMVPIDNLSDEEEDGGEEDKDETAADGNVEEITQVHEAYFHLPSLILQPR